MVPLLITDLIACLLLHLPVSFLTKLRTDALFDATFHIESKHNKNNIRSFSVKVIEIYVTDEKDSDSSSSDTLILEEM
jgi:hypothetical protein